MKGPLNKQIIFRVHEREYKLIQDLADNSNIEVSDYMRKLVKKAIRNQKRTISKCNKACTLIPHM